MDETDAQQQPYWRELEETARPARERRRLPPEVRSEIIVKLCRRAPLSVKDLSVLLNRSEAYVGDAIRPLVTSGLLTFLYPDQPRHPRQKYMAAGEAALMPPVEPELPPVPSAPPVSTAPRIPDPPFRGAPAVPAQRERLDSPAAPPAAEVPPPALPNRITNLVFVTVVGLVLGLTAGTWWWAVAIVAALVLSAVHVAAGSMQYRQFSSLRFLGSKQIGFLLLKSLVALLEIAIIYFIVRALFGPE